jgi:hypothetical protein
MINSFTANAMMQKVIETNKAELQPASSAPPCLVHLAAAGKLELSPSDAPDSVHIDITQISAARTLSLLSGNGASISASKTFWTNISLSRHPVGSSMREACDEPASRETRHGAWWVRGRRLSTRSSH